METTKEKTEAVLLSNTIKPNHSPLDQRGSIDSGLCVDGQEPEEENDTDDTSSIPGSLTSRFVAQDDDEDETTADRNDAENQMDENKSPTATANESIEPSETKATTPDLHPVSQTNGMDAPTHKRKRTISIEEKEDPEEEEEGDKENTEDGNDGESQIKRHKHKSEKKQKCNGREDGKSEASGDASGTDSDDDKKEANMDSEDSDGEDNDDKDPKKKKKQKTKSPTSNFSNEQLVDLREGKTRANYQYLVGSVIVCTNNKNRKGLQTQCKIHTTASRSAKSTDVFLKHHIVETPNGMLKSVVAKPRDKKKSKENVLLFIPEYDGNQGWYEKYTTSYNERFDQSTDFFSAMDTGKKEEYLVSCNNECKVHLTEINRDKHQSTKIVKQPIILPEAFRAILKKTENGKLKKSIDDEKNRTALNRISTIADEFSKKKQTPPVPMFNDHSRSNAVSVTTPVKIHPPPGPSPTSLSTPAFPDRPSAPASADVSKSNPISPAEKNQKLTNIKKTTATAACALWGLMKEKGLVDSTECENLLLNINNILRVTNGEDIGARLEGLKAGPKLILRSFMIGFQNTLYIHPTTLEAIRKTQTS